MRQCLFALLLAACLGTQTQAQEELTQMEIDRVMAEIARFWQVPAEVTAPARVELNLSLNSDATLAGVKVVDQGRYDNDASFRLFADSAIAAVRAAAEDGLDLPLDRPAAWSSLTLGFDLGRWSR